MKQASLWNSEGDRARAATWKRLPEKVRAEIVAQFVRLVVKSATQGHENIQNTKEKNQ